MDKYIRMIAILMSLNYKLVNIKFVQMEGDSIGLMNNDAILNKKGESLMCKDNSKTSTVQFRMDSKLKKDAEEVFRQLGLNTSTAYTLFAKTVVNQKKIPFEISLANSQSNSSDGLINLNEVK